MTVITASDMPSAKVFLDEIEVSCICTAADPGEGWVDLLPDGKAKADAEGNVITERKHGDVRVEIHVRFTESETVFQSRELDTSGGGSPFVKLDDKAKHEPEWLPVDWEGDSPFGDGDLKEPPVGVVYVDTE